METISIIGEAAKGIAVPVPVICNFVALLLEFEHLYSDKILVPLYLFN